MTISVRELLVELGIDTREHGEHTHVTSRFVGVDCPMCSPDSGKFRLGLSLNGRVTTCWVCGNLKPWEVIPEITGLSWGEWKDRVGITGPIRETAFSRKVHFPDGTGPLADAHKEYLKRKGFDPEEVECVWGVLGTRHRWDSLRWRLIIPVTRNGRLASWTSRSLKEDVVPRYISADEQHSVLPIKSCLYGDDMALSSVVVVEGPTDAWAVGPGAVATFGSAYTSSQVARIARFPRRTILFDSEPDAQRKAEALCMELSVFPGDTTRIELDTGKDPASADPKEIRLIRDSFLL